MTPLDPAHAKSSVLLIDDDPNVHLAVRTLFDQIGYRGKLLYCNRATQAMALLWPCPSFRLPKTILLDLNMPKMSGLQFLRQLRANPKLRSMQVFIVSGSQKPADREMARSLNALGFLPKSRAGFDVDVIRDTLAPIWSDGRGPVRRAG